MITIYLSGGIKGLTDEQAYGWRKGVIAHFRDTTAACGPMEVHAKHIDYGVSIIIPTRMSYRPDMDQKSASLWVTKRDKVSIFQSDIVLAYCPVPSWGTAMEIMYAHELDKWVVAVNDEEDFAVSPWLVSHADVIVPDFELAYDEISRIEKDMRGQMK